MRKVKAFIFVTLNGYFEGPGKTIDWHHHGKEENAFSAEMLKHGNTLLFGRVTYDLMVSYWTSPLAFTNDPIVADGMHRANKIVFSRTLKKAGWNNTTLVKTNVEQAIRKLKQQPGTDMVLLGSGSMLTQLAQKELIDEYQILVNPVILGDGTSIFKGFKGRLNVKLTKTRVFRSGNILLYYRPVKG